MLHITIGDSTAESLREAGLGGDVVAFREALYDGPLLADTSPDTWRETRARFYERCGYGTFATNLADLLATDQALAKYTEHDKVILWCEHDLLDQLSLIYLLDLFSSRNAAKTPLGLISVDRFPGVEPFFGLGQLRPDQLATLFPLSKPIAPEQLTLGRDAWRAVRSSDPRVVEYLLAGDTSALPFLAPALSRYLREFPSVRNGLSLTERRALGFLAEHGGLSGHELFRLALDAEECLFLGDQSFGQRMARLASGARPLWLSPAAPEPSSCLPVGLMHITDTGRSVLAGEQDWVRIRGIDSWIGGVHLFGAESPWRWDETAHRLVATAA
jgi:hypothetical protein